MHLVARVPRLIAKTVMTDWMVSQVLRQIDDIVVLAAAAAAAAAVVVAVAVMMMVQEYFQSFVVFSEY
jgi:hypothetical protein